jgi:nicotinate dehydrogenase subunit A
MSGIIMSAAALLAKNPDPDEVEIKEALARNLCRCGTHTRMIKAVKRAASDLRAGK